MSNVNVVRFKDLDRWDAQFFSGNHNLNSNFNLIKLGKILTPRKEKIKAHEYDGLTPIVAKIPFQSSCIELRKEPKTKMEMYAIYKNDLLVSNINFHQGAIAICEYDKIFASTHYQPYIVNTDLINRYFLALLLKQKSYQEYILAKKTRGIKTEANFNFIKELEIPLPPLEIQNKIVKDIENIRSKIKVLQEEEQRLKNEIDIYIYITLGLHKKEKVQKRKVFVARFKDLQRWDLTYNQSANFNETGKSEPKYPLVRLGKVLDINPSVDFKQFISDNKNVSFLPMQNISTDGTTFFTDQRAAKECKGFVKFKNNDLLWAKITPCMQNKKSVIVSNLKNGVGFGSTEFFVIRAKDSGQTDIKFILHFLRTDFLIEQAKLNFKGSAGQQRVPKEFLLNFQIPLPPLQIQEKIVADIENFKEQISNAKAEILTLKEQETAVLNSCF